MCWIIILILLLCGGCGGNNMCGNSYSGGCDNNCGCC
jgi:hypothetical protein